jgi:hypothetical protein
MSASLKAKDDQFEIELSNGTWKAITDIGASFHPGTPLWNGAHDGQEWTAEELELIAARLISIAEDLREFATHGGLTIS